MGEKFELRLESPVGAEPAVYPWPLPVYPPSPQWEVTGWYQLPDVDSLLRADGRRWSSRVVPVRCGSLPGRQNQRVTAHRGPTAGRAAVAEPARERLYSSVLITAVFPEHAYKTY
ncbi:uncharacterized protein AAG666_022874 isoform 2-T2 [Megaptera novaeangliae]